MGMKLRDMRELKEVPLWKLKRARRREMLVRRVLPWVVLVVMAGVLVTVLVLYVTEPRAAVEDVTVAPAEMTMPAERLSAAAGAFTEREYVENTTEASETATAATEPLTGASTEPDTEQNTEPDTEPDTEYLGTFTLTAYCNCPKCCGKWSGGPTASGVMPEAGRTIAVDPDVIPLGTRVRINGHEYIAEDTGSAIKGNRIDVYMDSHQAALEFGRQDAEVQIVRE